MAPEGNGRQPEHFEDASIETVQSRDPSLTSRGRSAVEGVRFDDSTTRRLRQRLMQKGGQTAALLADVLAGKDHARELRDLPVHDEPGDRPEEKLRRYLELIEARRRLIDAGDDAYGRCDVCGIDLGAAALEEMPWADRCVAHPVTVSS